MIEYRKARPEEKGKCIEFINLVFSMSHAPHDFMALIPKAYGKESCIEPTHYIAVEDGFIWGLVALLEGELTVLGTTLSTGVIGSVSAHPYARGKGYMKECMAMALQDAREKGLQLLYLGGKRQRYEYFGFTPGGMALSFRLSEDNFRHGAAHVDSTPFTFVPVEEYVPQAAALHAAQPVHALRSEADFALICRTWNGCGRAILKNGAFAGYLAGEISEMCLVDEDDCLAVCKAWHEQHGLAAVTVTVPVWHRSRARTLAKIAASSQVEPIEMFSLTDMAENIRLWLSLKASYTRLQEGEIVLQAGEDTLRIAVQENRVTVEQTDAEPTITLSRMEAQDLLLSNLRWVDTDSMPACVESWFPLPLSCQSVDGF